MTPGVLAVYPLHDHAFNRRWLRSWAGSWALTDKDLTAVRDHYGEEVAFYFAFVNFYIAWLVPPAAVGLIVAWTAGPYAMAHAAFNLAWSAFFLVYWRRRQREVPMPQTLQPLHPHAPSSSTLCGGSREKVATTAL